MTRGRRSTEERDAVAPPHVEHGASSAVVPVPPLMTAASDGRPAVGLPHGSSPLVKHYSSHRECPNAAVEISPNVVPVELHEARIADVIGLLDASRNLHGEINRERR